MLMSKESLELKIKESALQLKRFGQEGISSTTMFEMMEREMKYIKQVCDGNSALRKHYVAQYIDLMLGVDDGTETK
jgi:hypothetical protein